MPAAHSPAAVADVEVEVGHHDPGEYAFTPERLTLSLYLGPPLSLEQEADGSWRGVSVRGDVKVMLPGQERVFRHRDAATFATLELDALDPDEAERALAALRPRFIVRVPAVAQVAGAIARAAHHPRSRMFREAMASRLLALLVRHRGDEPRGRGLSRRTLARVLAFLDAHVADDLSVVDLAAVAGLKPSQFTALFRHSTGQPPHRYHVALRVERAARLLEHGADPTTAAHEAGFYDQSHLTRHMRRVLGVTPARHRRIVQDARPAAPHSGVTEASNDQASTTTR